MMRLMLSTEVKMQLTTMLTPPTRMAKVMVPITEMTSFWVSSLSKTACPFLCSRWPTSIKLAQDLVTKRWHSTNSMRTDSIDPTKPLDNPNQSKGSCPTATRASARGPLACNSSLTLTSSSLWLTSCVHASAPRSPLTLWRWCMADQSLGQTAGVALHPSPMPRSTAWSWSTTSTEENLRIALITTQRKQRLSFVAVQALPNFTGWWQP